MPKTVPKSSNDERRNLAGAPRGGSALNQVAANKRKLEPNDAEDLSGSSRKRPNRPDQIVDQRATNRGRAAGVDQRRRSSPPPEVNQDDQEVVDRARSNYLLEALRRIQELQDEIEFLENDPYEEDGDADDDSEDESGQFYGQDRAGASVIVGRQAEALGFAVCARETMAFLEREGVPRDAPMMVNLRARLIGEGN